MPPFSLSERTGWAMQVLTVSGDLNELLVSWSKSDCAFGWLQKIVDERNQRVTSILELNVILLRSVFVNPVFMREGRFAWSSNSPLQRVFLYRVRHVFYLSPMYTSWRVVWHYRSFDQCWSWSVRANWHSRGVHFRFLKNKTSWTRHLKFFTVCMISLW
jgi:hypothetical protein